MVQLQVALSVMCGVAAVLVLVQVARDRLVNRPILAWLAVIEVGLVVHLVQGIAWLTGGDRGISAATYVGYLAASLVVLPLAVGWAWAERSRSGTAVILVGLFLVPYLFLRLYDVAGPIR
ncbi:hypothetical protein OO014_16700 [Intrasporangium calvum]|uniref:Integral membrane protein n=1 Tax=Intrasporangium calvum TaxID=53358 RepID=A0ABT5GKZ1_9MICO|nr:hypothetical protein [Intrasporangium calvum]MDC5698894.1 hypothetical protein [Intrasporangium calvum]